MRKALIALLMLVASWQPSFADNHITYIRHMSGLTQSLQIKDTTLSGLHPERYRAYHQNLSCGVRAGRSLLRLSGKRE